MNILNWFRKKKPDTDSRALLGGSGDIFVTHSTPITDSGVRISEDNALTISAVFSAVSLLSSSIGFLPPYKMRRDERGAFRVQDPTDYLVHSAPNDENNAGNFWETAALHLLLWGNSYSYIEREDDVNVSALLPLLPDRTMTYRLDGKIVYQTTIQRGKNTETIYLRQDQVLHVKGLSYDGLVGLSPIALQREALGMTAAVAKHGAKYFGSGAHVRGMIEVPNTLSGEAAKRLRESFEQTYAGLSNAHKVAVLEEGAKFNPMSMSHEDAQFLQTRVFQLNEVARIFRVPSHMLNENSAATFSNIEHQQIEYIVHSLRPHIKRFEQEMNRKLLLESEKQDHYFEFNLDALLRGDTASRYSAYVSARSAGWMSGNEIRHREGLPVIDDPALNTYGNPAINKTPATDEQPDEPETEEPQPQEPVAEEEAPERSLIKGLTRNAIARVLRKEMKATERAAKKEDMTAWRLQFGEEIKSDMAEALQPYGDRAAGIADAYRNRFRDRQQPLTESEIEKETEHIMQCLEEWE